MASLLSTRRNTDGVALHASEADASAAQDLKAQPARPPFGWPLVAVVGGLGVALLTWLLCAGVTAMGWLSATSDASGSLSGALLVGTRLWLLGNGIGVGLGTLTVTLVPWGLTALAALGLCRVAILATRWIKPEQPSGPGVIAVTVLVAYLVPVVVLGIVAGEPWQAPARWGSVVIVLAAATGWGSTRAFELTRAQAVPTWLRRLPRAVVASQLVLAGAGAALLTASLVVHLGRVRELIASVEPGVAGGIALLLAQWAFVPNAVVWAASYALGAGFSLGAGTVVAPASTDLGLLPSIPLLGALPQAGPGSVSQAWWLAAGVLAGAVAAWITVREGARRSSGPWRVDLASLVGGLAGVASALVFVGIAWACSGDLGALRLAGLGPRLLPLLVMGCSTMGLAGMITGLLLRVIPRRRPRGPRT